MMFWDASALLPLIIDEPKSATIRVLAESTPSFVVWWGSAVECCSAFARMRREKLIDEQEEAQLRHLIDLLSETWSEIQPCREVRRMATRIFSLHPLRAADSLQLAAALIWAEKNPQGHVFICLDNKLRTAAAREGFIVLPDDT